MTRDILKMSNVLSHFDMRMHHFIHGRTVSPAEARLLHMSATTPNGPENQKPAEPTAPEVTPPVEATLDIASIDALTKGGVKNVVRGYLEDAEVRGKEVVKFGDTIRTLIASLPQFKNKTLGEVEALVSTLPKSHDDVITFAASAGLFTPAELFNLGRTAERRKATPKTGPAKSAEKRGPTLEQIRALKKAAGKKNDEFNSFRNSLLNEYRANMYRVPRAQRGAYYAEITAKIRQKRDSLGNPAAEYTRLAKIEKQMLGIPTELEHSPGWTPYTDQERAEQMDRAFEAEQRSPSRMVDPNVADRFAPQYGSGSEPWVGEGGRRSGDMDPMVLRAFQMRGSPNNSAAYALRQRARARALDFDLDEGEYGTMPQARTQREIAQRWGRGVDPLQRLSEDTRRVGLREGIDTREESLSGTDIAFASSVSSSVSRGRMIMPGSTSRYVVLENPNLRRSRINAQGQSYDAGDQYREYLRGRGLYVPEPRASRDVPRDWRPGQWATTFGSNLSPEQARVQSELRDFYTGENQDQVFNDYPDLKESTDLRIRSTYAQIMRALDRSLRKPGADSYHAFALARTRLDNLRRNMGMLQGNDRMATSAPLREMFFPVFGLNGDAYVMVEYDAEYRGRKEHRKVVIKDPRNWGDGMFTGPGSQDYAADAGIHVQVDNFADGRIRGMTLQFSKPGKYFVSGEMIEIKAPAAAPVAKAETAKSASAPAAAAETAPSSTPKSAATKSETAGPTPKLTPDVPEQVKREWLQKLGSTLVRYNSAFSIAQKVDIIASLLSEKTLSIPVSIAQKFIDSIDEDLKKNKDSTDTNFSLLQRIRDYFKEGMPRPPAAKLPKPASEKPASSPESKPAAEKPAEIKKTPDDFLNQYHNVETLEAKVKVLDELFAEIDRATLAIPQSIFKQLYDEIAGDLMKSAAEADVPARKRLAEYQGKIFLQLPPDLPVMPKPRSETPAPSPETQPALPADVTTFLTQFTGQKMKEMMKSENTKEIDLELKQAKRTLVLIEKIDSYRGVIDMLKLYISALEAKAEKAASSAKPEAPGAKPAVDDAIEKLKRAAEGK